MRVTVIGLKPAVQRRLAAACPGVDLRFWGTADRRRAKMSGVGCVVIALRFVGHSIQESARAAFGDGRVHLHRGCLTGLPELVRGLAASGEPPRRRDRKGVRRG